MSQQHMDDASQPMLSVCHREYNGIATDIRLLGPAKLDSPLPFRAWADDRRIPIYVDRELCDDFDDPVCLCFEAAGPRRKLYFDPRRAKCAIVTCGGLCPGLNDVIRSIVLEAYHAYDVPSVLGIRYGLEGFISRYGHAVAELTPQRVSDIHRFGGTILGTSRGPQSPEEIVDMLERNNVNILFVIGGDGSMKAAQAIATEVSARNLKLSVIGIPKTIDNDINFIAQSFGFETAVAKATEAIQCAHTEACGVHNGVGLVKLMGRESGFIAARAALALKEVNFVLVPEAPFRLEGEGGLRWSGGWRRGIMPSSWWPRARASICWICAAKRTFRAIPCWGTSPPCCSGRSGATSGSVRCRIRSSSSTPATSSVPCPPPPTTRCTAASWASTPSMPPWPDARRWWWAACRTSSCICRCRW